MNAASVQAPFDGFVSAAAARFTSRAAFDAFFACWLPRIHRFAAQRLATTREAEAATRAIFEAALRARLVGTEREVAPRILAIARAEIARRSRAGA